MMNFERVEMRAIFVAVLVLAFALTGCVAKLAADIVTAPIKVGSAVVDAATTSQSEADRNRGRALRKEEEREDKARKKAEKESDSAPY